MLRFEEEAGAVVDTEVVQLEITGGVATVRLNRPEAMNALNVATKEALSRTIDQCAADDAIRAVVLTGTGRAFCVGQDLNEHLEVLQSGDPSPLATVARHYNPIVSSLASMPKPVIAAVNGVAAGAGFAFALACDLRIGASTARFTTAFTGIALTADSGLSWTLPRTVGYSRAMQLLLLRPQLTAEQALAEQILHEVVSPESLTDRVQELAAELAAGPTTAFAAVKQAVAFGATHDLVGTLALESDLQAWCGSSQDHAEAVAAFVEKRPPQFVGK